MLGLRLGEPRVLVFEAPRLERRLRDEGVGFGFRVYNCRDIPL